MGVDPLSYFSFQPVFHDWCNKGRGMCYPVCGMVHIKEPLLLIGNSSPCGGSWFPFSLSECRTANHYDFLYFITPLSPYSEILRYIFNFPSYIISVGPYPPVGSILLSGPSCSLGYFPFQPVVHNWFIKGRGMYCSVYGKVHIKDPLLLIEKSSLCGGSGFPSKKCVNVTI